MMKQKKRLCNLDPVDTEGIESNLNKFDCKMPSRINLIVLLSLLRTCYLLFVNMLNFQCVYKQLLEFP